MLTVRAPAKINFTLDVGERRADGYHPIHSVMQTVSLCDTLTIKRTLNTPGVVLEVTGEEAAGVPADASNIVHKAAVRLQKIAAARQLIAGDESGLHIVLHKRIPSQAGLGGGSSDAAATLCAVKSLFGLSLSPTRLTELGAELGADVPFFLTGGLALAEGLGERLTPFGPPAPNNGGVRTEEVRVGFPQNWGLGGTPLVVVKPPVGVSTKDAYASLDAVPGRIPGTATDTWRGGLRGTLGNDFEAVILHAYPEVSAVYEALRDAPEGHPDYPPLLCGSGACVFRIAQSRDAAGEWAARINAEGRWKAWATETVGAEWEPGV